MSDEQLNRCLACGRGSELTPLIPLEYRGERIWICPQHLPVLIHDPGQLVGRLEGAEHCALPSITIDALANRQRNRLRE